jgi:hypothetical protein
VIASLAFGFREVRAVERQAHQVTGEPEIVESLTHPALQKEGIKKPRFDFDRAAWGQSLLTIFESPLASTGTKTPSSSSVEICRIGQRSFSTTMLTRSPNTTASSLTHSTLLVSDYQSAYCVPLRAVASDPLLTSLIPGAALGLVGSGSLGIVCQVVALIVNGSSGTLRI